MWWDKKKNHDLLNVGGRQYTIFKKFINTSHDVHVWFKTESEKLHDTVSVIYKSCEKQNRSIKFLSSYKIQKKNYA